MTPGERIDLMIKNNLVNPNYSKSKEYRYNCALCATAAALQARGYDVEAMPRDKDWRGPDSVFDIDFANTDNYILTGSKYNISGAPRPSNGKVMVAKNGKVQWIDAPLMPKGSKAATNAIINKVKGWGDGAVGVLNGKQVEPIL